MTDKTRTTGPTHANDGQPVPNVQRVPPAQPGIPAPPTASRPAPVPAAPPNKGRT